MQGRNFVLYEGVAVCAIFTGFLLWLLFRQVWERWSRWPVEVGDVWHRKRDDAYYVVEEIGTICDSSANVGYGFEGHVYWGTGTDYNDGFPNHTSLGCIYPKRQWMAEFKRGEWEQILSAAEIAVARARASELASTPYDVEAA